MFSPAIFEGLGRGRLPETVKMFLISFYEKNIFTLNTNGVEKEKGQSTESWAFMEFKEIKQLEYFMMYPSSSSQIA